MKLELEFEEIQIVDGKILNYPTHDNQEFILYNEKNGYYVHGISELSYEDTAYGSELMLLCIDFRSYEALELQDYTHIAYLKSDKDDI